MRTALCTRVPSARFTRHLALSSGRLLSSTAGRRFSTEASTDASSTPKLLSVNKSTDGDYAYLTMSSPPVNAISSAMATELTQTIAELEADSSVRGFVLGSSVPGIFSAGLQLECRAVRMRFSIPVRERVSSCWTLNLGSSGGAQGCKL